MPWMYRLVASPFLESKIAVAIVGYRTYPDGNAQDQVDDLYEAAKTLARLYPKLWYSKHRNKDSSSFGVSLMGHSSGAHIAMLLLVQLIEKQIQKLKRSSLGESVSQKRYNQDDILQFDSYVGISGVYNIQRHLAFEAGRGVEEISPMKPACGFTNAEFDRHSPALRLEAFLKEMNENSDGTCMMDNVVDFNTTKLIPPMLLVHGVEDDVVPFTSTSEAARIIKSCGAENCTELYPSETGHVDVVMHFMFGGRSTGTVIDWLVDLPDHRK